MIQGIKNMLKNKSAQTLLKLAPNHISHHYDSNDTLIVSIGHFMINLLRSKVFEKQLKSQLAGLTKKLTRQIV